MAYRILVADDEKEIRDLLRLYLEKDGYQVVEASDGREALSLLEQGETDMALLDIMMPRMDGYNVLKKLRETSNIPVMILSAKDRDTDKILGLDLGADDYLAKPFGMMEMVSRVKAVLRRSPNRQPQKVLGLQGLRLEPQSCTVHVDGQRADLTLKEYKLLLVFMENIGRAFTRDQLLEIVWGLHYVGETRTVDVHIGTLRAKLGKYGGLISTVRGVGYRMEGAL